MSVAMEIYLSACTMDSLEVVGPKLQAQRLQLTAGFKPLCQFLYQTVGIMALVIRETRQEVNFIVKKQNACEMLV